MADPIKVTKCSTENTDLLLPSHVDLVEGLDTRIQDKITSHYNTTVTAAISALSNTYLGKNANAVSATKATNDGDGNKISTTYYKKTDTVTNAANAVNATNAVNDSNGNNIIDTYVTKTDVVANATNAVHATYADYDSSDVNARNSIRDYFIGVSTNDNHSITFSRGSGQSVKLTIADTTTPPPPRPGSCPPPIKQSSTASKPTLRLGFTRNLNAPPLLITATSII